MLTQSRLIPKVPLYMMQKKSGFCFGDLVDLFNFDGVSISPEIKQIQKGTGL